MASEKSSHLRYPKAPLGLVLLAVVAAFSPLEAFAQSPNRLCIVPNQVVYAIGGDTGHDTCHDSGHLEFVQSPAGDGWSLTGNFGTLKAGQFLGTLDLGPLEFRVNGQQVMKFEVIGLLGGDLATGPSITTGHPLNSIASEAYAATISGGGNATSPNTIGSNGFTATIGGGEGNTANADLAVIGGGAANLATGTASTIGGGEGNSSSGIGSTVGGGTKNDAAGLFSTISGGSSNSAAGASAIVLGGFQNDASGTSSLAAGRQAKALHDGAFVWADYTQSDFMSTGTNQFLIRAAGGVGIGTSSPAAELDVEGMVRATGLQITTAPNAGYVLTADATGVATWQPVPGGSGTVGWALDGNAATQAAGHFLGTTDDDPFEVRVNSARVALFENEAGAVSPNVLLGFATNTIAAGVVGASVGGGGIAAFPHSVATSANFSTIGGGQGNTVGAFASTVAGGAQNSAETSPYGTVGGGVNNTASGFAATVPGGELNRATGQHSLAGGKRAVAGHDGSFVWGDATNADVVSTAANQFIARASGGVSFYSSGDLSAGVTLAPGSGSWSSLSDRNAKADFEDVSAENVLAAVTQLPIQSWRYSAQDASVRHIGPIAQDFRAAFGLGENDLTISTVDIGGVNMVSIQALEARTAQLKSENEALRTRLAALEDLMAELIRGAR